MDENEDEILDWTACTLFKQVQANVSEDANISQRLISEEQCTEYIELISNRKKDFKDYELLTPYYVRVLNTLREVIGG